jgi:hypothetical protein
MDMLDFTRDKIIEILQKLRGADLRGIGLSKAKLWRANLFQTDLRFADFRFRAARQELLEFAHGNEGGQYHYRTSERIKCAYTILLLFRVL